MGWVRVSDSHRIRMLAHDHNGATILDIPGINGSCRGFNGYVGVGGRWGVRLQTNG